MSAHILGSEGGRKGCSVCEIEGGTTLTARRKENTEHEVGINLVRKKQPAWKRGGGAVTSTD